MSYNTPSTPPRTLQATKNYIRVTMRTLQMWFITEVPEDCAGWTLGDLVAELERTVGDCAHILMLYSIFTKREWGILVIRH